MCFMTNYCQIVEMILKQCNQWLYDRVNCAMVHLGVAALVAQRLRSAASCSIQRADSNYRRNGKNMTEATRLFTSL